MIGNKRNEHIVLEIKVMNFKIPENIRHSVIRLWTEGKSRKHIAITCGLGQHTVSSIVAESRQNLGNGDAEALRELGIDMKGIDMKGIDMK
jgi:hypothetical protein